MRTIRTPFQQSLSGYLIAIVATAAVAAVRLAISDTVGNFAPIVTFNVAIVIAAWYGGLGPGLLATALSALTACAEQTSAKKERERTRHRVGRT